MVLTMTTLPDVHVSHADQPEVGALTHLGVQSQHLARAQLGVKQVHLKISPYEELQNDFCFYFDISFQIFPKYI